MKHFSNHSLLAAAIIAPLSSLSLPTAAHNNFEPQRGTRLNASVLVSVQEGEHSRDTTWHVPGTLMSGEAHTLESGFSLNEASIQVSHNLDHGFFAQIEAGSHGHDSSEFSFEQVVIGHYWEFDAQSLKAEAGRMKAIFDGRNAQHPSARLFTEDSLFNQVLLAGHYADEGVRAQWRFPWSKHHHVTAGLELWQGDAFPGSTLENDLASDIFVHYNWQGASWGISSGLWGFQVQATQRSDEDSGHQHSTSTSDDPLSFSGKTQIFGAFADIHWSHANSATIGLRFDVSDTQIRGDIANTTHQAGFESDLLSEQVTVYAQHYPHRIALSYEGLEVENRLGGAGASTLINAYDLAPLHHPKRFSLAYQRALSLSSAVRLEYSRDESTVEAENIARISFIWKDNLWRSDE